MKTKPNRGLSCQLNIRCTKELRDQVEKARWEKGMNKNEFVRWCISLGLRRGKTKSVA